MANLQCKYGQSSNLSYTEISDGPVYVCKDTLDVYADIVRSEIISAIYPIGLIYMSITDTDPATLFGVGTW